MLDIAIFIPTLKLSKRVENTLFSIFNSEFEGSYKVFVIVNGKAENEELQEFKNKFPQVNWTIIGKNLGFAGGINKVIYKVKAKYYFLLNDDTFLFEDTLKNISLFEWEKYNAAVIGAKIYYEDGKTIQHAGGVISKNLLTSHVGNGEVDRGQYDTIKEYPYVTGAAFVINGKYFEKYGGLSDKYFPGFYEETEYCIRAKKRGYKILYYPDFKIIHLESQSFKKFSNFFFFHYHKNRLIFLIRNYPLCYYPIFIKEEFKWLKNIKPKEQYKTLMKAYISVFFKFPYYFLTRRK